MTDTQTPTTDQITAVVDAYLASLDEPDATKRAELVAQAWAPDGRYTDPLQELNGHAELASMQAVVQEHYAGASFRRTSGIDAHHDSVRFAWDLTYPDGTLVIAGIDVGRLGPDGKLTSITGFFGDLPAA
ncbi:MAG TPA: nuclear transport factor 2 family protein [Acidimicrobiales bacterium]